MFASCHVVLTCSGLWFARRWARSRSGMVGNCLRSLRWCEAMRVSSGCGLVKAEVIRGSSGSRTVRSCAS